MQYQKLNKSGELAIEFQDLNGLGEIVTKELLSGIVQGISIRATKYFDETNDYVFRYKERQMHSVVCPAIADITPSFLIEHPLERKPVGEEKYRGHVDYWASYKRLSYLIELKHAYQAYTQQPHRKNISDKFSRAIRQLKDVRTDECEYLCQGTKKLLKIALEGITFYKGSVNKESLSDIRLEELETAFEQLRKTVKNANMYALWVVDKRMTDPFDYIDSGHDYFEIYPAVAFVAKVF